MSFPPRSFGQKRCLGPTIASTSGGWPIGCGRARGSSSARVATLCRSCTWTPWYGDCCSRSSIRMPSGRLTTSNDQRMTAEEFLRAIADEVGGKVPRIHVPYRALYGAATVAEWIATLTKREPLVTRHGVQMFGSHNPLSIDKARRELGYEPEVALRDGIRLAGNWYRENVLGATAESAAAVSPATA